ncbi:Glutamate synthase domain-containing protein 2 [Paucidesulfovibrio gracilis DSM 16080]|uniref:Glutamate synthase domain-containing protein 2 n=1 Tax=Paucidesulfovibrio gracilis DSM 16080 TaxID=1121449 RepID=A0A1T4WA49_9BACT|nr:glutamate synthase-related protein [Paucidesulfovibrio gracilis]SKA74156.1 Glutamate synthase domain-containing protein 2 [Paucidesulfovibrio gracilis DSM 16080]
MNNWPKSNDVLGSVNRGNAIESGLCTLCRADCQGKCETWLSSLRGREMLYPRDFGLVTAGSGNTTHVGVSYNSVRIQGNNYGAFGTPGENGDFLFTDVNLETSFGADEKTKCRVPFMTGALGSTFIAAKYWDAFAVGCALVGAPIVIGENVVGVDRDSKIEKGRISSAPELDRRIDIYRKYYDGYGAIIVQLNVEDTRNGVAEYVAEKYGDDVIIELKWGQGAKNIGGEIEVTSLDYALFLKQRGYLVDPDPEKPSVQEAFKNGAIHTFARHSRLGYTDLSSFDQVHDDFMSTVEYLRKLGFKRISLKTGSYGMEALAMAIKFASEAKLDLLTIDGSGGGTGMSPWNMMESWGVPSVLLHAKAHEYATRLAAKGENVVDLSFAGGFAKGSNIFKALAMGAPFSKLICMGRAMMVPGFVGSNIEGVLRPDRREAVNGNWDKLPASVAKYGHSAEEIFACWHDVEAKVGKDAMKDIPYGAVGVWCLVDKLSAALQQLLAGVRKFELSAISRGDIASGNRETERETGIPFITSIGDEIAHKIIDM